MIDGDGLLKPFDAFLYCRVSSDEQMDRGTIKNQIEFGEQYAKLNRATILGIFTDDGVSGVLPLEDRPGGAQLLTAIRQHPGAKVLVYAVDRLGRDVKVVVDAAYALEGMGCAVRSMTQPFDTADALGKAILALLAGFAAMEREGILARTSGGSRRKARAGGYLGGKPPFGLEVVGRGPEAELVLCQRLVEGMGMPLHEFCAYLYERTAAGASSPALAEELNARGISPPSVLMQESIKSERLNLWHAPAIVRIIRNTAARGVYTYGKVSRKGTTRPVGNIIERPCPRMVSDELWERANARVTENRRYAGRESSELPYLLRGKIKCGNCEGAYTGQSFESGRTNKRTIKQYRCNNRARGTKCTGRAVSADIEEVVWQDIVQMCLNPDEIARRLQVLSGDQADPNAQLLQRIEADRKRVQEVLSRKQAEKDAMLGLFRRGRISEADLDRNLDQIEAESASLHQEVQKLESSAQRQKEKSRTRGELVDTVEQIYKQLQVHGAEEATAGVTWERRRELVEKLVRYVKVTTDSEDKVEIGLRYTFDELSAVRKTGSDCTGLISGEGQINYIQTLAEGE